jgi:hypothetical protein
MYVGSGEHDIAHVTSLTCGGTMFTYLPFRLTFLCAQHSAEASNCDLRIMAAGHLKDVAVGGHYFKNADLIP